MAAVALGVAEGDASGAVLAGSVLAVAGLVWAGLGLAGLVAVALLPADADALPSAETAAAWPAERPSLGRIRKATKPMASATQPAARIGARLRRRDSATARWTPCRAEVSGTRSNSSR